MTKINKQKLKEISNLYKKSSPMDLVLRDDAEDLYNVCNYVESDFSYSKAMLKEIGICLKGNISVLLFNLVVSICIFYKMYEYNFTGFIGGMLIFVIPYITIRCMNSIFSYYQSSQNKVIYLEDYLYPSGFLLHIFPLYVGRIYIHYLFTATIDYVGWLLLVMGVCIYTFIRYRDIKQSVKNII